MSNDYEGRVEAVAQWTRTLQGGGTRLKELLGRCRLPDVIFLQEIAGGKGPTWARQVIGWRADELLGRSVVALRRDRVLLTPQCARGEVKEALAEMTDEDIDTLHQLYARATGDWRRAAIARRIGELTKDPPSLDIGH